MYEIKTFRELGVPIDSLPKYIADRDENRITEYCSNHCKYASECQDYKE